jgi:hypothetical protein
MHIRDQFLNIYIYIYTSARAHTHTHTRTHIHTLTNTLKHTMKKLPIKELCKVYSSPNVIDLKKFRKMCQVGQAKRMAK